MNDVTKIIYRANNGFTSWQTDLTIDPKLGLIATNKTKPPAQWTRLAQNQCSCCLLNDERTCPIAANLDTISEQWRNLASFDEVEVSVEIDQRTTTLSTTTTQQVLSSIVGIIMASSPGCSVTTFLRPMVVFHRPFASQEESVYRALANMALLYQLTQPSASFQDFCLAHYEKLHSVNLGLVSRIRGANPNDESLINALVNLDTFVKSIIYNVTKGYHDLTDIGF